MSNNFDEAAAATEDLFAQEQLPQNNEEEITNEQAEESVAVEEAPAENSPTGTEEPTAGQTEIETAPSAIEQAAQTAETAAQVAVEKDSQLKQALSDIESLKQQNQQLQGTIDELSQKNAENIIDEALTPPTLDINGLAFADEEAQRAAMAKFAEEMSTYDRQQIMKEMSPVLEYAKKGMREAEKTEVLEALSQVPELSGIKEMLPQLDRLIGNNKFLSSSDMPMDEQYINAFAMLKGINSINNPPEPKKEPSTEELMELYNNNSAFRELVEKQRLDTIKNSQQVPSMSASSGAAGAALNIKEKPQTLEEASRRTREMFRGM